MDKAKIGPREAADTIRDDFEHEHADPRFLHGVRFAKEVLKELGQDASVENVAKVMRLLAAHGIEGHSFHDYPAWVVNERGETAVVNDEEHEAEFMARPPATDEGGVPNPEHGHIDPQTGVFTAGRKSIEHDEAFEPEPDHIDQPPIVDPHGPQANVT